jgi:peptidoglycan/LPS O-acetylase OafA/YrhL
MLRSRHIYILASALVNLMLGLYVERCPAGWRRIVQAIGSGLLIGSTALLVLAFVVEPEKGFQPEMWWSATGLYALFLGCMAHLASSIGKARLNMERNAAGKS